MKDNSICPICNNNKKHISKNNKTAGYCKECYPKYRKTYRDKPGNRQKAIASYNKCIYGKGLLLLNEDILNQNECSICKTPKEELDRTLCIDHNHDTGEIRGMLCSKCNTGLGLFKDNEAYLLEAVEYLRKNGSYFKK